MEIAVIGGSIAGCTAAFALKQMGCQVQVFERSKEPLSGRGASVILAQPLFEKCFEVGLLDNHLPFVELTSLDYCCRGSTSNERWLGSASLRGAAMHWSSLYSALRSHVSDDSFHLDATVVRQALTGNKAEIEFADGRKAAFDVVIHADGYRSSGRSIVDPEARLSFADVVLVRGVMEEEPADGCLEGRAVRFLYADGHGICYLIPGDDGATALGHRRVSCSFFLPAHNEYGFSEAARTLREDGSRTTLDALFSDRSARLSELLDSELPDYVSHLLRRTSNFYVQPVLSVEVQSHVLDRSCLIGDAGCVFPPYSNSGVMKAVGNAFSLADALAKESDLPTALSAWNTMQMQMDKRIAADAQRAGKMLIYDVPNVAAFDNEQSKAYLETLHPGFDVKALN